MCYISDNWRLVLGVTDSLNGIPISLGTVPRSFASKFDVVRVQRSFEVLVIMSVGDT